MFVLFNDFFDLCIEVMKYVYIYFFLIIYYVLLLFKWLLDEGIGELVYYVIIIKKFIVVW